MCVIGIVFYYFDMLLSRHHIIYTAFLDIAQHICEYFCCLFVCLDISQYNGVYWSVYIGSYIIFIAVMVTRIIRPPL